ncbi:MAG TPA: M56 family metallopeptidase, partial [Saprospiraceae bacterium]|nr:M56 family metallopeptidase [Saprospiraceae bacterium]
MNNTSFISDAFVRALGLTLVHSLWQGALAALVLFALLYRLQTAKQRYWAAYGALIAVFSAALVTFGWVYQSDSDTSVSQVFAEDGRLLSQYLISSSPVETDLWQRTTNWLEANYPLIVAVWMLGFGFFLLRFAGGVWHVNRLSRLGTSRADAYWEEKIAALGERLGMSRSVRLLESALAHTPVAIGWLKPVILLPVGLINRLSPAEVEAILAHELAHIARRDWVFNLLQAFIETLFYYQPAIWWMSNVIRNERENCCDDAALAATGNRIAFAKALVQVQEMAKPTPALALGIKGPGRRPLLLERIRRILNQPQQKSQIMEKFTATVILFALLTLVGIRANNAPSLSAAFAQMTEFPAVLFDAADQQDQITNDSVPKPKSTRKIVREDDNQRVEAEYQDNKLTRLNIDGKEIPASEFEQHRDLTNELRRELRAPVAPTPPMPPGIFFFPAPPSPAGAPTPPVPPMPPMPPRISTTKDGDGNTVIMLERNGEPMEIKVKEGQVWVDGDQLEEGESLDLPGFGNGFFYWNGADGNTFNFTPEGGFHFEGLESLEGLEGIEGLQYIENLDEFPHFKLSEEDKARLEEEQARVRGEADRIRNEHRQIVIEQKRLREEEMKMMEKEMKERKTEWEKEQKRWQKEQKQWAEEQEKWGKEQEKWAKEQAKSNAFGKDLKSQLLSDGLISDPSNFQFQLSGTELKVNGVKQSADLHRKYLEFYQAKTGKDFGKNGNFFWTE